MTPRLPRPIFTRHSFTRPGWLSEPGCAPNTLQLELTRDYVAQVEESTITTQAGMLILLILIFFYLQLLDALTTLLGFRLGLSEASPFIRALQHVGMGAVTALCVSKVVALGLLVVCVVTERIRAVLIIDAWYAGLVMWNLGVLLRYAHLYAHLYLHLA